jgi:ABC-type enterochelin transport system permease subunit
MSRTGIFMTFMYVVTLAVLIFFTHEDYRFLKEQFGSSKRSPAKGVLIIAMIFTVSFLCRLSLIIFEIITPQEFLKIQCEGYTNDGKWWAILVISIQFFGETLPLSVLFFI